MALHHEDERVKDHRAGQLCAIAWNAAFTGERRTPSFFFPSLRETERPEREPRTVAEAKQMAKERSARITRNLRQAWG